MDGVYTDSIIPPKHLNGTSSARITIKAFNDGGARIDGGSKRIPIKLNNSYFLLEGMNAYNSHCNVVQIGTGANNNILRRIVAWDANDYQNCVVWGVNNNRGNLLEDVAGFGTGRKIFQWYGSGLGSTVTIRRAWGRWERSVDPRPKSTFQPAYNSHGGLFENILATWDETAMAGAHVSQAMGLIRIARIDNLSLTCSNTRVLGSIAYVPPGALAPGRTAIDVGERKTDCVTLEHTVSAPSTGKPVNLRNLVGDHKSEGGPILNYRNGTEIGGATSTVDSNWTVTNRATGATVNDVPNIWNGAGTNSARVCKRYLNGSLTNQPLWPWPMNQRIIDAMKAAGKTPVDVTKTMEQMFGTIPVECRSNSAVLVVPVSPTTLVVNN
jgi:hypothetical protein